MTRPSFSRDVQPARSTVAWCTECVARDHPRPPCSTPGESRRLVISVACIVVALADNGCADLLNLQDRTVEVDSDATDGQGDDETRGLDAQGGGTETASVDAADASTDRTTSTDGRDASPDVTLSTDAPDVDADGTLSTDTSDASPDVTVSTDASDAGTDVTVPTDASGTADAIPLLDSRADARDTSSPEAAACPDPCDMADGLDNPYGMTSDVSNIYWVECGDAYGAGNGSLKSCGVDGCGNSPAVWQTNLMNPRGVAVDSNYIYWSTGTSTHLGIVGGIWSCPLASAGPVACTSPSKLATGLVPLGITVDRDYVYWADVGANSVSRVAIASPGSQELLYGEPDGGLGTVFIDSPTQVVVDNTNLWVIDASSNVYYLPKSGGTPNMMYLSSGTIAAGITVDPKGIVYFGDKNQIWSGDVNGSTLVVSNYALQPYGLYIDHTTGLLYWADFGNGLDNDAGSVGRVSTTGKNPTYLQRGLAIPDSITVSGSYVYWLSGGQLASTGSTTTTYAIKNTGVLWRTAK